MRVAHRDHRKTYRTSLVDLTSTLLQRLHCGVVFEAHELVVLKVQLPELRELPKAGVRKKKQDIMETYGPVRGGQSRHVDYMSTIQTGSQLMKFTKIMEQQNLKTSPHPTPKNINLLID